MAPAWLDVKQIDILLALLVGMILGGIIGVERQMLAKPAGVRTHMIVAGAAALLVSLDRVLTARFAVEFGTSGYFRADPVGVMQAIVTGVSFLGAGTIIRQAAGEHVEGLTTAASLLFTAAVGIASGLQQWIIAVGSVVLVLVTLRFVHHVDFWIEDRRRKRGQQGRPSGLPPGSGPGSSRDQADHPA